MCKDNMFRCEFFAQPPHGLQQGLVVGNKNLDAITDLGQFRRRPDKIWNRTRRSIPNEDLETFPAQILTHSTTDNSKTDHSDVFVRWMGHGRKALRRGGILDPNCGQKRRQATRKFRNIALPTELYAGKEIATRTCASQMQP